MLLLNLQVGIGYTQKMLHSTRIYLWAQIKYKYIMLLEEVQGRYYYRVYMKHTPNMLFGKQK